MRQHSAPVLVAVDGSAAPLTALAADAHGYSEAAIQALIQAHPGCLPINEIDPLFADPVPICTELNTLAGPIDNVMVTASGLPVLVECKLWRNPQARREVVGQILDYAKELSRWSSSDLQREASRRLGRPGNAVLDLVRAAGHDVDETDFNDALTHNLRRGRFLLLIVGDGIREGIEAIAEYLQAHAGLHFTLGLVEMPIYAVPGGGTLVAPRVLARTELITRTVVALPEGLVIDDDTAPSTDEPTPDAMTADRVAFWTDVLDGLKLTDPDQPVPKPSRQGYVAFMLPAPAGSCWLTVFRNVAAGRVGVFLSYSRNSVGERAVGRILAEQWPDIKRELGGTARLFDDKLGRRLIEDDFTAGSLVDTAVRARAIEWLRMRTDEFVTVLRPRIKAAVADIISRS